MNTTNRREFLKLAASAGATAAVAGAVRSRADSQPIPGRVRAWRTTKYQKFQPVDSPPQWETWTAVSPVGIQ
ncbi:MAG: twin-arginine translocation signal domain-containing protein, partial [Terriglobia bacterium]